MEIKFHKIDLKEIEIYIKNLFLFRSWVFRVQPIDTVGDPIIVDHRTKNLKCKLGSGKVSTLKDTYFSSRVDRTASKRCCRSSNEGSRDMNLRASSIMALETVSRICRVKFGSIWLSFMIFKLLYNFHGCNMESHESSKVLDMKSKMRL